VNENGRGITTGTIRAQMVPLRVQRVDPEGEEAGFCNLLRNAEAPRVENPCGIWAYPKGQVRTGQKIGLDSRHS
jgi:hypothetical protein